MKRRHPPRTPNQGGRQHRHLQCRRRHRGFAGRPTGAAFDAVTLPRTPRPSVRQSGRAPRSDRQAGGRTDGRRDGQSAENYSAFSAAIIGLLDAAPSTRHTAPFTPYHQLRHLSAINYGKSHKSYLQKMRWCITLLCAVCIQGVLSVRGLGWIDLN